MKRFAAIISIVMIMMFVLMSISALAGFSVTTTARINLRTAPGTEYKSLGIIDKGVTLNVSEVGVDSKGTAWYRVAAIGQTGWISSDYAAQSVVPVPSKVTITGNANVRAGAGLGYVSLGVINKGNTAEYLNQASVDSRGVIWYRISFGSLTGWVSSKYAVLN